MSRGMLGCLASVALMAGGLGDPMKGQALFVSKRCVACHAIRGHGGKVGPDLGRTAAKASFGERVAAMWNHLPVMEGKMREARIVRPTFAEGELGDLVAFLYFLNYFDEPGNPSEGRAVFSRKHCIQCHRIGTEGGRTGPPLDRIPRGTPPLHLARDLWNHGPAMIPLMGSKGLAFPTFEGNDVLHLFAYLRSQGPRRGARDFRSAGDPAKGRALFAAKGCAQCHAFFGKAGLGPDLGTADLRGSVTLLAGRMWNHWPAMTQAMKELGLPSPAFKGEEMADLFAFMFVTRYEGPPPDRAKGRAVYARAGCVRCHGEEGGGGVGPALAPTRGEGQESLARRMWNHAPAMSKQMGARGIPWPRFEADELPALLAFLDAGWAPPRRIPITVRH